MEILAKEFAGVRHALSRGGIQELEFIDMRGHDGIAIQRHGHHGKAGRAMGGIFHLTDLDLGIGGGGAQQQGGKKQSDELFHRKTLLLK